MYYAHQGNDEKATSFFLNAIKDGNQSNQISDLSFAHLEFSKFLWKKGDYKAAYVNLSKYNEITEELYNKEKLDKANVAGINVQLEEYKREIEKEAQLQIVEKSKTIVVLLTVISLMLLLLLYTLFKNNNFRIKSNAALSKTNEALLIAKEKAEEASVLKSQFVSTISHELRTPLYGVVGI
ncbi:MAG: hybrid sensor histidine kinase/response regulator, partial [Methylotenera sp.]|nr:hybrid sensor histidine kinase/response regulator [Flavobacterium sp.]